MKKAIFVLASFGLFMSSCSVTRKTSTVRQIHPVVENYPTVADIKVGQKVSKTTSWNFSLFSNKIMDSRKIRTDNLMADLIKDCDADILFEPEAVYTKKSFGRRTLTVTGYPASLSNIRNASVSDLDTLKADTLQRKKLYVLGKNESEKLQVTEVEQRKTRFVLRAGYAMNSKMGGTRNYSVHPGYTVSIEAVTQINPVFYWNIGVAFASRGYLEKKEYYSFSENSTFRAHVFQMPIGVGGKWGKSDKFKFDLHGGFFWSCDMVGECREDGYSYDISDFSGYSRMDVGMMLGAGIWIRNFNLDCTYQPGFVVFNDDGLQNSLWFRLGYAF